MAQGDSAARVEVAQKDGRTPVQVYKDILSKPITVTSEASIREYETALIKLGELYRDEK